MTLPKNEAICKEGRDSVADAVANGSKDEMLSSKNADMPSVVHQAFEKVSLHSKSTRKCRGNGFLVKSDRRLMSLQLGDYNSRYEA